MEALPEKDCTYSCRSSDHAKKILNCVINATPPQIKAYSVWLCHNFSKVSDKFGRNILHAAASCDKSEIVEWLLEQCNASVNIKDLESGWSALHRSFFYGQLRSSLCLINHGANLGSLDHEGFTPLDLLIKDRLPYVEYQPTDPSDVYVWGCNSNYTLGSINLKETSTPEILEWFRRGSIPIKQVIMCKFHSVFLSVNGKVFTCGHGPGGRLGQGSENTCLLPSRVKFQEQQPCVQVAAGQDHTLMLFEDGEVMSCGLNNYHQLGHSPPMGKLQVPKAIVAKPLLGKKIVRVCAAHFHSVICTRDAMYTFGLNAGQLGHPKRDRTQLSPKLVSSFYSDKYDLSLVEVSVGATVCATSNGDVYILHEYQRKRIVSRQIGIVKLSVVGGQLDPDCGLDLAHEGGASELRVALLTKSGKVFLWRESDPHLRRCLFSSPKQLLISDVHINLSSIAMVTTDNEGYLGHISPFKGDQSAPVPTSRAAGFNVLINRHECNIVQVKRVPHVHRGTSIISDCLGKNFAVLQSSPKMGFVELPMLSDSNMKQDFLRLLSEADATDGICDIIIKVGSKEFAAHKYILSSQSEYFKSQFSKEHTATSSGTLSIDSKVMKPEIFEQILKFMYSNSCDALSPGYEVKWEGSTESNKQKKKSSSGDKKPKIVVDPLMLLKDACRYLKIPKLLKSLEGVTVTNNYVMSVKSEALPKLKFDRQNLRHLSDVNLISDNRTVLPCHRCILVSRLEYFRSMLSCCWMENSNLKELHLQMPSDVLAAVLDYLYTDEANKVLASDNIEFLCRVLMYSDQLLIPRLKEICEVALVESMTLKNAAELLELSTIFNSVQLKQSCMEFICINLPAFIETKSLDVLSNESMNELSRKYKQMIPSMRKRRMTMRLNEPTSEQLAHIESTFPISDDYVMEKGKSRLFGKSKSKKKSPLQKDAKGLSPKPRTKSNSESSEKDIVLDIAPKIEAVTLEHAVAVEAGKNLMPQGPSQRIMAFPKISEISEFYKLMLEEKQNLTVLRKGNTYDFKPVPRLSQKQKRQANKSGSPEDIAAEIPSPKTPTCPWANTIQASPPPPCFWDTLNKRTLESPNAKSSQLATASPSQAEAFPKLGDQVISLDKIQRDEEMKSRKLPKPKIKPLHIINVEDAAIEELLVLYKAKDNPDERISVSRVLPEYASPVWKGRMP